MVGRCDLRGFEQKALGTPDAAEGAPPLSLRRNSWLGIQVSKASDNSAGPTSSRTVRWRIPVGRPRGPSVLYAPSDELVNVQLLFVCSQAVERLR